MQRKISKTRDDEAALTADMVNLARQHGRYGYRRVTALQFFTSQIIKRQSTH